MTNELGKNKVIEMIGADAQAKVISETNEALNSKAANQMLIYRYPKHATNPLVIAPFTSYKENGLFNGLRNEMKAMADDLNYTHSYPAKTRNVALVDGSLEALPVQSDNGANLGSHQQILEVFHNSALHTVEMKAWTLPTYGQGLKEIAKFKAKIRNWVLITSPITVSVVIATTTVLYFIPFIGAVVGTVFRVITLVSWITSTVLAIV